MEFFYFLRPKGEKILKTTNLLENSYPIELRQEGFSSQIAYPLLTLRLPLSNRNTLIVTNFKAKQLLIDKIVIISSYK